MEQVLVVKTALLQPFLTKDGLITGCEEKLYALVEKEHRFLLRSAAEEDPSYRQIVPYIVLCRGDEVFCTRRLNKGTEKRLHGRVAVGLGGHINPSDEDGQDVFLRGLHRELEEEASFVPAGELKPVGVINDAGTEVGLVHLGFAFTLEVKSASVRETEKLEGFWIKKSELPSLSDELENWAQAVLPVL